VRLAAAHGLRQIESTVLRLASQAIETALYQQLKAGREMVPPEKITLAEVIRHIEGPLAPVSCVSERFYEKCSCPDESRCGIRSIMQEVRDAIVRILEGVTLAQLCERVRKLQGTGSDPLDFVI
jgi:hypothetical protein